MAIVTAVFQTQIGSNPQPFADLTFTLDDRTRIISGVSGTINGTAVEGLSDYLGASNSLQRVRFRPGIGSDSFNYNYGNVSIKAGGVDYNFVGTSLPPNFAADTADITASNGSRYQAVTPSLPGGYQDALCFVAGTLIETTRGAIAVEDLKQGDAAVTAAGKLRQFQWTGHRTLNAQPIRISADAFGEGLPRRPLYLSSGHPILVGADSDNEGGVLVPVMCLINGTSITREPRATVTYWHVELDAHDILLAEGLPAESYIDLGTRTWFVGEDGGLADPDHVPVKAPGRCRPVSVNGPVVEAERLRLNAVFADLLSAQCAWAKDVHIAVNA